MANPQTLNAIASLLKGFQAGYGGAKEYASSEEEKAMRNRFQQAQMEKMTKDQDLEMLKYQSGIPEIEARIKYYQTQNEPVPSGIADPTLVKLGITPIGQPISTSAFSTLGGMVNNLNTNNTRQTIGRNTPGNTDKDVLKEWSKQKREFENQLKDYDIQIEKNSHLKSVMQDENDKKRMDIETETARAGQSVVKWKLQQLINSGRENGINPALLTMTSDADYQTYLADQKAKADEANRINQTQGGAMGSTPTATSQPMTPRPSLKDMLINSFMKR